MEVCRSISEFQRVRRGLDGSVALVPTMGALHEAHLSLMGEARRRADHVVVSIFVNPTQFGPDSDYDAYPRELRRDCQKCEEAGASVVFAPSEDEMYGEEASTVVRVAQLTDGLCGAHRPGHFEGVTTVVAKLFNIADPDVAIFGEKDYQQLVVIRRMVRDLNFDIEIVGAPTVRESDGLAVSSRNRYLGEAQRRRARSLSSALVEAWHLYHRGERDCAELVGAARERLLEAVEPEDLEYVECVDPGTLESFERGEVDDGEGALLAVAVYVGSARLIDNLRLDRPLPEGLAE